MSNPYAVLFKRFCQVIISLVPYGLIWYGLSIHGLHYSCIGLGIMLFIEIQYKSKD
jgi:hypothetical protein